MTKQEKLTIDMWNGEEFIPKKYYADASFYPHGSFGYSYRGNIYNDKGECIGDYGANDSLVIEENFIIEWV